MAKTIAYVSAKHEETNRTVMRTPMSMLAFRLQGRFTDTDSRNRSGIEYMGIL